MRETSTGIEIRRISKVYPGVKALDNVSMYIGAGEIVGLVGHNGAGKSTLTRVLAGAERPDSGALYLASERMRLRSIEEGIKRGIALVPQQTLIVPNLSVRENLEFGAARQRARRVAQGSIADDHGSYVSAAPLHLVVHQLGLESRLGVRADKLRPAFQRLIMIGRALLCRPQVIILDEATAALSQPEVLRLFTILRSMRERKVVILYITHRLDEVLELADRVIVMREGRVVHEAKATQLTREKLTALIVGRDTLEKDRAPRSQTVGQEELFRCTRLTRFPKIRDVSFTLHRGEVLGITGLVGSGRTSLVRILCGVDAPDSGEIVIGNRPVRFASPRQAIEHGLAYLPEDRGRNAIVPEMTVAENVTLPIVRKFTHSRVLPLLDLHRETGTVRAMLQRLQIHPSQCERLKAKFLSGGNQQKALLARWLLTRAEVFVFDEPTEGIDVGVRREVYDLINELVREGAGVFVSSSDIAEVAALSHRVLVMRNGTIVESFEGESVSEGSIKEACLVGA